jgi:hypothetical protein
MTRKLRPLSFVSDTATIQDCPYPTQRLTVTSAITSGTTGKFNVGQKVSL